MQDLSEWRITHNSVGQEGELHTTVWGSVGLVRMRNYIQHCGTCQDGELHTTVWGLSGWRITYNSVELVRMENYIQQCGACQDEELQCTYHSVGCVRTKEAIHTV